MEFGVGLDTRIPEIFLKTVQNLFCFQSSESLVTLPRMRTFWIPYWICLPLIPSDIVPSNHRGWPSISLIVRNISPSCPLHTPTLFIAPPTTLDTSPHLSMNILHPLLGRWGTKLYWILCVLHFTSFVLYRLWSKGCFFAAIAVFCSFRS